MAIYGIEDIARAAYRAGFRGGSLVTAVAVAMGEGGGYDHKNKRWVFKSDIQGDVGIQTAKWGPSVSPWQIRSVNAERGTGGHRDAAALTDLDHAAEAAFAISNGGRNWKPWTVFTRGIHKSHTPTAQSVVGSLNFDRDSTTRMAELREPETAFRDPATAAETASIDTGPPRVSRETQRTTLLSSFATVADAFAGGPREWPTGEDVEVDPAELFGARPTEPEQKVA